MLADEQPEGNLRATLAISQEEAHNGTTRSIMLPGGKRIAVSIPAGASNGSQIQLTRSLEENSPWKITLTVIITQSESSEPQIDPLQDIPTVTINRASTRPPHSIGGEVRDITNRPAPQSHSSFRQIHTRTTNRRTPLFLVILLTLLALLLIIVSYLAYRAIYDPGHLSSQTTNSTQRRAASASQAAATSTARITASVQAQIRATATAVSALQGSYDQITRDSPVLNDPLTSPDNNWDTGPGCTFINGAYHAISIQKGFIVPCYNRSSKFSDFVYQVQLSILKGNYGGIVFRADTINTRLYLFRIGQDGSYNLDYYPDGTAANTRILIDSTSTLILTGPGAANQVAVIARGTSISLYINGNYLTTINDASQTIGQIGVIADDTKDPTEVVYSRAQVWTL